MKFFRLLALLLSVDYLGKYSYVSHTTPDRLFYKNIDRVQTTLHVGHDKVNYEETTNH